MVVYVMLGLVTQSASFAQTGNSQVYSQEAERKFENGRRSYIKAEYKNALEEFEAVISMPANQRSSAALFMYSKTLAKLNQCREAINVVRRIEREFSHSRYLFDARLLAGDCFYKLKRNYEAAAEYVHILASPAPLSLQVSAAECLAAIVKNQDISPDAVQAFRQKLGARRFSEAVWFGEGRWYARLGWVARSREQLASYIVGMPNGLFVDFARKMLSSAGSSRSSSTVFQSASSKIPKSEFLDHRPGQGTSANYEISPFQNEDSRPVVGVLMPLSGGESYLGEELFDGIRLANDHFGNPFKLRVIDVGEHRVVGAGSNESSFSIPQSEGNRLIRTVAAAQALAEDSTVVAIIGPVFSTSCVAASSVAEAAGIPLIAPLAQQSGIDSLGKNIFQLNVVPEIQGRELAEYATLVLGLNKLVVLAPLTDYGWNFHRSFVELVRANGGDVVHSDWYVPEETTDFQNQFEAIREAGFTLMPTPEPFDSLATFDSLSVVVIDTTALGDGTFYELLEAGIDSIVVEESPDSTEIFIDTMDGIAVVVETFEDARRIAAQLRFFRLKTQILGNDIWHRPEEIRQMDPIERAYVEGVVFVSGRHRAEKAQEFTDAFRARFGRDPGFAAYGYDAIEILISGWEEGHQSRVTLRNWLANLDGYEGTAGLVSFSEDLRVNTEVTFWKIDSRGRVGEVVANDLPRLLPTENDLPSE